MLPVLVFGLCLLAGLVLLGGWFANADPKMLARAIKVGGAVLAVVVVVALALAGRLGVAIAAVAALLPVLLRWRAIANRFKAARGPEPGRKSALRTAFLDVELDHDTGTITGTVRDGRFAGRALGELTLDELRALHAECEHGDPQSAPIVAAFLDRTFGADWRDTAEAKAGPRRRSGGAMTREEALNILGLSPGASDREIREAHRRLMKKLHPDQGGSDYLAAKLNEAKDVLLG
ncbi:MAG TPA: DnaJ domain-containing protein [Alphaproteobacteria bacterium]|nr:DnaJ domain-containing protein [Alphaproteobacteria bacterium]